MKDEEKVPTRETREFLESQVGEWPVLVNGMIYDFPVNGHLCTRTHFFMA